VGDSQIIHRSLLQLCSACTVRANNDFYTVSPLQTAKRCISEVEQTSTKVGGLQKVRSQQQPKLSDFYSFGSQANQDASKCANRWDKLERLFKVKERQKDEAIHMEDTQRLVTEIEMLKFVLYLVNRNRNGNRNILNNSTMPEQKNEKKKEKELLKD
jgi:hypothetical protein